MFLMITLSIHVLTFVYKDPQTVSHYLVLTLQIITIITVIKWLNYTLFHHIVHIIFFFCFFTFTNITTVNKGNCIKSLCNQNPNDMTNSRSEVYVQFKCLLQGHNFSTPSSVFKFHTINTEIHPLCNTIISMLKLKSYKKKWYYWLGVSKVIFWLFAEVMKKSERYDVLFTCWNVHVWLKPNSFTHSDIL